MSPRTKKVSLQEMTLAEAVENLIPTTQQERVKRLLCIMLKHAYDETQAEIFDVEFDVPGSQPRSPRKPSHGEIPLPPPEPEQEYQVRVTYYRNPHKQELLDKALAMGCAWAKEEKERRE